MPAGDLSGAGLYALTPVASDYFLAGAKVPVSGIVTFNLAPQSGQYDWLVSYAIATLSSSAGTASTATSAQCILYSNSVQQANLWDYTSIGAAVANVGWYMPPRRMRATDLLVAQFTNCNPNDYAQVRIEYLFDTSSGR